MPKSRRWVFPEADPARVHLDKDADYIIARIVERGMLADVKWLVRTYGVERIREFFRDVGHPELSARTRRFWRAFFNAEDETWAEPPSWRRHSAVPWPG